MTTATVPPDSASKLNVTRGADGKEIYTSRPSSKSQAPGTPGTSILPTSATPSPAPQPVEEEDDLDVAVPEGTKCRRLGCGKTFIDEQESRLKDGENATCIYHSLPPLFREGSKVRSLYYLTLSFSDNMFSGLSVLQA